MAGSKITTDHDEIRKWAEERGGRPATVRSTHDKGHGGPQKRRDRHYPHRVPRCAELEA